MKFSQTVRDVSSLLLFALVTLGCSSSDVEDAPLENPEAQETSAPTTSAPREADAASTTDSASIDSGEEEMFPNVLDATATSEGDGLWSISATLSSPYDSPDRYADAWRVVGADGAVYGQRILTHDHAGEQPFTRSQSGIAIPADVASVRIEGRDQVSGWGGDTFTLKLPA